MEKLEWWAKVPDPRNSQFILKNRVVTISIKAVREDSAGEEKESVTKIVTTKLTHVHQINKRGVAAGNTRAKLNLLKE